MGAEFGLSELQHIIAAMARQLQLILCSDWTFDMTGDDVTENQAYDLQAGHTTSTSDAIYGRAGDDQSRAGAMFRYISDRHQYYVLGLRSKSPMGKNSDIDAIMNKQPAILDIKNLAANVAALRDEVKEMNMVRQKFNLPTTVAQQSRDRAFLPNVMPIHGSSGQSGRLSPRLLEATLFNDDFGGNEPVSREGGDIMDFAPSHLSSAPIHAPIQGRQPLPSPEM